MKIVIAPDAFKESLSAAEVALAIEAGFREVFPAAEICRLPVADGGEGTVDARVAALGGRRVAARVTGPLGEPVEAFYGLCGDGATVVIEMAAASGLALVPSARRNPLLTTSFGTGELIRAALDAGARHLIVGIGGSATNDAGAGMLQALGAALLDGAGRPSAAAAKRWPTSRASPSMGWTRGSPGVASRWPATLTIRSRASEAPRRYLARRRAPRRPWCSASTPISRILPRCCSVTWASQWPTCRVRVRRVA